MCIHIYMYTYYVQTILFSAAYNFNRKYGQLLKYAKSGKPNMRSSHYGMILKCNVKKKKKKKTRSKLMDNVKSFRVLI